MKEERSEPDTSRTSRRPAVAAVGIAAVVFLVGIVMLTSTLTAPRAGQPSQPPLSGGDASGVISGPVSQQPGPGDGSVAFSSPPTHINAAANGTIAFVDGHSLKMAAADGSHVRTVASVAEGAERLAFSPDGTKLAYRTTGSIPSIVVADADGSHPAVLAKDVRIAKGLPMAWSPDSRRIAFTWILVADKVGTVAVVDADTLNRHDVIEAPGAEEMDRFGAAWSPDGQWISFFTTDAGFEVSLNVIHPDGSGAQRLETTPMNPDVLRMAWSPDPEEQRLVYVAGSEVKMYDLGDATETTVGAGFWPTWSPTGSVLTWWSEGTHLVPVADLLAGHQTSRMIFPVVPGSCREDTFLAGKAICGAAEWSPDGSWIYGFDVLGSSILFARADGTGSSHSIALDQQVDLNELADDGQIAWQAVSLR